MGYNWWTAVRVKIVVSASKVSAVVFLACVMNCATNAKKAYHFLPVINLDDEVSHSLVISLFDNGLNNWLAKIKYIWRMKWSFSTLYLHYEKVLCILRWIVVCKLLRFRMAIFCSSRIGLFHTNLRPSVGFSLFAKNNASSTGNRCHLSPVSCIFWCRGGWKSVLFMPILPRVTYSSSSSYYFNTHMGYLGLSRYGL